VHSSRAKMLLGPVVTLATLGGIALIDRVFGPVPNPGAIYFLAVVFATYIGGFGAGLVSAAVTFAFTFLHFSTSGDAQTIRAEDWTRLLVLTGTLPAIVAMVGLLKLQTDKALRTEQQVRSVVEGNNRDLVALQAALDQVDYGVVLLDSELRAQFINRMFRCIFKLPDAIADANPPFVALMYHGRNTRAYAISKKDLDVYVTERVRLVRAGDPNPIDIRLSSGEIVRFTCTVLPNGGRMLSYVKVTDLVRHANDLEVRASNDRKHAEEMKAAAHEESQVRLIVEAKNRELVALQAALNEVDYAVVLLDQELRAQFINRAFRRLTKISEPDAAGSPTYAELLRHSRNSEVISVSDENLDDYIAERVRLVRVADPQPLDIRLRDGRTLRLECSVIPNDGRMLSWVDITDLTKHAEQLDGYRLLAENAGDVVIRLSLDGVRQYVSPAVERVLGWRPEELLKARPAELMNSIGASEWERSMAAVRGGQDNTTVIAQARHRDGSFIWTEATLRLVRDRKSGAPVEIVAVLRDISKRKAVEAALHEANEKLRALSVTDSLTGLSNRRSFDNALDRECRRAERAGQPISVIMIDIDRFKPYNDTYGHQAGDQCIQRVARAISEAFHRPGDLAARYGGEEFAVILPETDELGAIYVAEKLRSAVYGIAIEHGGSDWGMVTISLGVACAEGGESFDQAALVGRADQALYQAKRTGRNKVCCFSEMQQDQVA
jgi:diguanylate cyclase (GGDEF)-like protein/PAS domain S-box-containing protein